MKAKYKTFIQLAMMALGLLSPLSEYAQWNFLGEQWLCSTSPTSQSIALNHLRQVHVALVLDGAAQVQRFDGQDWQLEGTGLPAQGQSACALAFDQQDVALLALGAPLRLYRLDNGNWLPVPGLPALSSVSHLQIRIGPGNVHWLALRQGGMTDSTIVLSDRGGPFWYREAALPGKLLDFELDEDGDPIILREGDMALLRRHQGSWQTMTPFSQSNASYLAFAMTQDGTGTGLVVLRKSQGNAFSVEQLSNGNWQLLGNADFVQGDQADLAISQSGVLHLVAVDYGIQGLPAVLQFVGGTWAFLGGPYLYNNTIQAPLLAFDPATVYVLFQDAEQNLQSSVMYLGNPLDAPEAAPPIGLEIFPNPAAEQLQLHFPDQPHGQLLLFNALGQRCGTWTLKGETDLRIDLRLLANGPYWLQIQGPRMASQYFKFMKLQP